jgi:hypothetical protein
MAKAAVMAVVAVLGVATESKAISLTDWTTVGNSGTLGADGVVPLSPFGDSQYGWVSTNNGVDGVGLPGIGGSGTPTNGSTVTSPLFSANAGDALEFYFNYVTSDGSGFADYAWAEVLDNSFNQVALLFTARTTESGNTVPGFNMPPLNATLDPANTPIIAGGPAWSPLGDSSGRCYAEGCGYTGWIKASYNLAAAGTYALRFGVVNWTDTAYDSGLAFDGATIAGKPIEPGTPIPTPALLPGLIGMGVAAWRKRKADAQAEVGEEA